MLELLESKLRRQCQSNDERASSQYPIDKLEHLELREILWLVYRLGSLAAGNKAKKPRIGNSRDLQTYLESAHQFFANWPNGMFAFLDKLAERSLESRMRHFGLRRQFEDFYSLFKDCPFVAKINFIRDAFLEFGDVHWKQGVLDKRLLSRKDVGYKLLHQVARSDTAKQLGVDPRMVNVLLRDGEIKGTVLRRGHATRYLLDKSSLQRSRVAGHSFNRRRAASILGIPVSVLMELRRDGLYEVNHLPRPRKAFNEHDLESFRCKALATTADRVEFASDNDEWVSLGMVLRNKKGSASLKAQVLHAVLSSKLRPIGKSGEKIGDLIFMRNEITDFYERLKNESTQYVPASVAIRSLGGDYAVIRSLVQRGLLTGYETRRVLLIDKACIARFSERYVPSNAIARELGVSARRVQHIVRKSKLKAIVIPWGNGTSGRIFLAHKDVAFVKQAIHDSVHG